MVRSSPEVATVAPSSDPEGLMTVLSSKTSWYWRPLRSRALEDGDWEAENDLRLWNSPKGASLTPLGGSWQI